MALCLSLCALTLTAQSYRIGTAAQLGDNGDNGPATEASLVYPLGLAVARDGTVYVSQPAYHRVRRITPNGTITTYAGIGSPGFSGDGGAAASAELNAPRDLVLDTRGNLYVMDSGNGRVRRIAPDGKIQTVAGSGWGDNTKTTVPALELKFCNIGGIALDPSGILYVSETDGCPSGSRVWRVGSDGMATVYTTGAAPSSLVFDNGGNLYFIDLFHEIWRRTSSGQKEKVTGSTFDAKVPIGVAVRNIDFEGVNSLATDPQGNLYVSSRSGLYSRSAVFVIRDGTVSLVAGVNDGNSEGYDGEGGVKLFAPVGMGLDAAGNLYVADFRNHRIRRLSPDGSLTTIAGSRRLPDKSVAPFFRFGAATAIATGSDGALYFGDWLLAQIRKIAPGGQISQVAGNGFTTITGDGGPATNAGLGAYLHALALDRSGQLYLSSSDTSILRTVSPAGNIATAYQPSPGSQTVGAIGSVATDTSGTVYFTLQNQKGIWSMSGGTVLQVYDGSATSLAVSPSGVLHFLDSQAVYKINSAGVQRVAGTPNPKPGLVNDGLPATDAFLPWPSCISFDAAGNLYIAGQVVYGGPGAVWRVGSDGIQHRIAGPTDGPSSPDGTPAASAAFSVPYGIAVDASGRVFLAMGFEIRVLVPETGSGCSTRLSRSTVDVPTAGGDIQLDVNSTAYMCPWQVSSQSSWIMPSVAGGSGSGSIVLHIGANNSGARETTVSIGEASVVVRQSGALTISAATLSAANASVAYTTSFTASGGAPPYSWSLAAGSLPSGLTLSAAGAISGTPATPGSFAFTVRVTDSASTSATQIFTLSVATGVVVGQIVSAASGLAGPVAPGEIVVIYGSGLGPAKLAGLTLTSAGLVSTQLAGTSVLFAGTPAPILYTLAGQVAAVVPYTTSASQPKVLVTYQGQSSEPFPITLADTAPGLFTADSSGKGQAAALNEDGFYNSGDHPAPAGSTIVLYGTGEGQTAPSGQDGMPASDPLPKPLLPLTVTIGGQHAEILYAGGAPGQTAGVLQLNVRIPSDMPGGNHSVVVQVGDASSNADVTIAIR